MVQKDANACERNALLGVFVKLEINWELFVRWFLQPREGEKKL